MIPPPEPPPKPTEPDWSFAVDPPLADEADLQAFLTRLVQAAGGMGGLLTTWEEGRARTSSYGLEPEARDALARLLESGEPGRGGEGPGPWEGGVLGEDLRLGLESLKAVAVPVRVQGRPVGLFCLLHPGDAPRFMREEPHVYNLAIDRLELVVENARLLHFLMQERRWLEALVHHGADGVAVLDREGKVVGLNGALEKLSGWGVSEAVGRPAHELLPLRLGGPAQRGLTLYRGGAAWPFPVSAEPVEAVLLDRRGGEVDVEVSGVTVPDEQGHPAGWVMTLRDIRQRKETERLGRVFLSALSHELQTPIAVIKGFAGLLSDPEVALGPEQAREKAAVILEESERLQKMIRQMLEATSFQAGGLRVHLEPTALDDLVRRTVRRFEAQARAAGTALRASLPEGLPPARADGPRVEQVLANLVENALKHGPGGEVAIEVEPRGDQLRVRVLDRGPGVAPQDRERIFRLFERGAEPRVRGSGLGLFIAKALIEAQGGRIGVEASPGGGAAFYFLLPKESA